MKKITGLILAAVLMLSLSVAALAESDDRLITVTGTADVALPADGVTMQLGAMTRGDSVAEAQTENDRILEAVIKALRELNIDEKDISTNTYNVNADTPYWDMSASIKPPSTTFIVTNMLNVTIRDLSILPKAIDAATKAGANQIYGLNFTSSKATEAYHKALGRAVEDAQKKAETLAAATGKTLGELLRVSTGQNDYTPYGMRNSISLPDAESAKSIVAGDISISAFVTLVYGFR